MSAYSWRAARYTHVAAGSTDSIIVPTGLSSPNQTGASITIYNIHASNGSGATAQILVEEAGTTNVIAIIQVPPGDSHDLTGGCPFLADKGVQITTPASCTATVFHSNAGA